MKAFGGKRHVSATHIRLIEDHNEVYHHLLKSLWVSLSLRDPGAGKGGVSPILQSFSLSHRIRYPDLPL